jgi:transposase
MDFKLPVLRREAKAWRKISPRVCFRLLLLIELEKFRQRRRSGRRRLSDADYEIVASRFGKSGRSLRRYAQGYARSGVAGVQPKPIRGRRARPLRGRLAQRVLGWRRRYNWGAEVIQAHLVHDHGVRLSRYRIERFLRRKKLLKKIRRKPKSKHTRKVRVETPGVFTQIDVKYVTKALKSGARVYVYSFVDHASKWRFKRAFEMFGNLQTKAFMEELLLKVPFRIQMLQSDNGGEFTNRFNSHPDDPKPHLLDELCKTHGIRHKLIPPGEKELQGLVERNHRQDEEELYHRLERRVETVSGLNSRLDEYCTWANACRRRKALGWKTSDQWLLEYRRSQESIKSKSEDAEEPCNITRMAA